MSEIEDRYRNVLQQAGDFITAMIASNGFKENGFALILFETGQSGGKMSYISNCERENILNAMSEYVLRNDSLALQQEAKKQGGPFTPSMGVLHTMARISQVTYPGRIAFFNIIHNEVTGETLSNSNIASKGQAIELLKHILGDLSAQENPQ